MLTWLRSNLKCSQTVTPVHCALLTLQSAFLSAISVQPCRQAGWSHPHCTDEETGVAEDPLLEEEISFPFCFCNILPLACPCFPFVVIWAAW